MGSQRSNQAHIDFNALQKVVFQNVFVVFVEHDFGVAHGRKAQCPYSQRPQKPGIGGRRKDLRFYLAVHAFHGVTKCPIPRVDFPIRIGRSMGHFDCHFWIHSAPSDLAALGGILAAFLAPNVQHVTYFLRLHQGRNSNIQAAGRNGRDDIVGIRVPHRHPRLERGDIQRSHVSQGSLLFGHHGVGAVLVVRHFQQIPLALSKL
mmetsp:Transcript_11075/g.28082  ORF Transcript_11075/g.28082 Transcript_11075/m.28082 type:complete len:204 (-) Transcript_11075:106-717(-)